jgi:hypothetical protein
VSGERANMHLHSVAPNRTLLKAGLNYVKGYMTVPGPLNFQQAVNRWAIERQVLVPG